MRKKVTLSELIKTAGINAVATACGCGKTSVYEWCNGRTVGHRYRTALCGALNISVSRLRALSAGAGE